MAKRRPLTDEEREQRRERQRELVVASIEQGPVGPDRTPHGLRRGLRPCRSIERVLVDEAAAAIAA